MFAVAKRQEPKKPGTFGFNLLRLRQAAQLTQDELALKSGVNRVTIARLETGAHEGPDPKTVRALARALDCPEQELWRPAEAAAAVSEHPGRLSAVMTAEQFLAKPRGLTDHEQEIIRKLGRTRPGAVERWTENDWLELVKIIRAQFPPQLG